MWLEIVLGKGFALHTVKLDESKSEGWEGIHNTGESCQVFAVPFWKSLLGNVITKAQSNTQIHKPQPYQVRSILTVLGKLRSP